MQKTKKSPAKQMIEIQLKSIEVSPNTLYLIEEELGISPQGLKKLLENASIERLLDIMREVILK